MEDSGVRRAAESNSCPCAPYVSHEVTVRRKTVDARRWMGASGEVVEMKSREGAHAVSGANGCRASAACVGCARVLRAYVTGSDTA
eukprot:1464589-Pleurochrysis_carterae.AAC.4